MTKHDKTLEALRAAIPPKTLDWNRVESLLLHLGASSEQGRGSHMSWELNGAIWVTYKPHPGNDLKRYQVKDLIEFLTCAGIL